MKKYILYAGVNGAGKSTLYNTTHYCKTMPHINIVYIIL
jgi:predicted ABC-type ATPase